MKATIRPLAICLLGSFLFQGCVNYRYSPPVYYPPPRSTVPAPPQPPPHEEERSVSMPEPARQAPGQDGGVAANFSREAAMQARQGKLDLASATLERGLRVAPKDAALWSQLAEVKLQQQQYQQARSLAAKSNSLARGSSGVVQRNHWIIEESRRRSGGY